MPHRRSRAELEEDVADDDALTRADTTLILHRSTTPQGIAVVSVMIACACARPWLCVYMYICGTDIRMLGLDLS
jgi:hypothetical protein